MAEHYRYVGFNVDCGRMGELDGRFVLDEDGWKRLQDLIESKEDVNYGEVLGKHSEIYGPVRPSEITVITEDQEWLSKARLLAIDLNSGFNPLDYYEPEDG